MNSSVFRIVAMSFALAAAATSGGDVAHKVELAILSADNWDRCAPLGKEVDAVHGDAVLRNGYLTAVIAAPTAQRHANMVVRDVGGGLVDLTPRDCQSDQLAAFLPGRRKFPCRSWTFTVNGGERFPLKSTTSMSGSRIQLVVRSAGKDDRPEMEVRYELGEADRFLTITSRFTNVGQTALLIPLQDEILVDDSAENMLKTEDGSHLAYAVEDRFWRQAYELRSSDGRTLQTRTDGTVGLIRYLDRAGSDTVSLAPGESVEFTRQISCGPTRLHIAENFSDLEESPFRQVTLKVRDGLKRGLQGALVEIHREEQRLGCGRTNRDGELEVPLTEGDYVLRVSHHGLAFDAIPVHVGQPSRQSPYVICNDYRPGTVSVTITDEAGQGLPCKLAFIGQGKTASPEFGPETGSFGVRNLRYTPDGKFIERLAPGEYQVIVSRGPEYDAVLETIRVESGRNLPLEKVLRRSVDTTGWISCDFHGHSSPSGDTTASQQGRVLNLVCEHIEFAPCTEHNRVASYQRHLDRLGINPFLASVPGMELTGEPTALNRQILFPLTRHYREQDGGGPPTHPDVETQVRQLIDWDEGSEKLIQQNLADIGWLFFDKNGDGEPDGGHAHTDLLDVIEIGPLEEALALLPENGVASPDLTDNRLFHWLQMLNQGILKPATANSNAHDNFHGSGGLRNWIRCSTDRPEEIDPLEIVRHAKAGRMFLSNGPFLRVEAHADAATESVTPGETLSAPAGSLTVEVSVQCPNWFDIDTVFVLVNGRTKPDLIFTRENAPASFSSQTERFSRSIPLKLETDAHIIVVACGAQSLLGPVRGPQTGTLPPVAVTNPLYVDFDGNGFQANRDTLDRPLPGKQQ